MKTLVIHSTDPSTDFLKEIYRDKDYTVINHNPSNKELIQAIKSHGRIMMMGHGVPQGLIGHGKLIINSSYIYLLRGKLCVGIWCNADQFFKRYNLQGFFTGMFISEVGEARVNLIETTQEKVTYSNEYFASEFRKYENMICVHQLIKSHYNSFDCPVIQFNNDRLYENNMNAIVDDLLHEHYIDIVDDFLNDEDDIDPAGGHGLFSHI